MYKVYTVRQLQLLRFDKRIVSVFVHFVAEMPWQIAHSQSEPYQYLFGKQVRNEPQWGVLQCDQAHKMIIEPLTVL